MTTKLSLSELKITLNCLEMLFGQKPYNSPHTPLPLRCIQITPRSRRLSRICNQRAWIVKKSIPVKAAVPNRITTRSLFRYIERCNDLHG